jgi:hypothetical protein
MLRGDRRIAALITIVCGILFFASFAAGVAAGPASGVPKSAPAFTKFVGRTIQNLIPGAKVSVMGRLQLDVELPGGGHTTDLHTVYSACLRNPDKCQLLVDTFVAQALGIYRDADAPVTRAALRVVLRPSAYVAALRQNAKRNRPLAAQFVGDYWLIDVIDRPASIAMLDEDDLGALRLTAKDALLLALENTREAMQPSLEKEIAGSSCRGIIGDDIYTPSSVIFFDLWAPMAQRCGDHLLVAIPADGVVLFLDEGEPSSTDTIRQFADKVMASANKPFTDAIFRWTANGWMPVAAAPRMGN